MNRLIAQYDAFRCECCLDVKDNDEKASCESMDIDVCIDCHRSECPNIRLCEIAERF